MNQRLIRPLLIAAALAAAPPALAAGDAAKGKAIFSRCSGCHALTGKSVAGPSLAGVVGRKAGADAGFHYSKAMKASGTVWTEAKLDAFLAAPAKALPGTSMFVSVPNPTERADLIAYLKTLPAR